MNRERLRLSVEANATFEYTRSGGPGGQNVNKVNSKAIARISLGAVEGLSEAERSHARVRLASRLTNGDELVVSVDEERDQVRNRGIALARLVTLLESAAAIPKPRRPTKPSRASREKRLASKRIDSDKKRRRGGAGRED